MNARPPRPLSEGRRAARRGETLRAFIAIEIDEATRAAIRDVVHFLKAQPGSHRLRWVEPQNLHLTLRFLGDVGALHVTRTAQHVADTIRGIAPFTVQLGRVHPFPLDHPRLLSVAITPSASLMRLAEAVERGVENAGLRAELRPFLPHLTIARAKDDALPAFEHLPMRTLGAFETREIVFFRSELTPAGPVHTPLIRLPL